MANEYTLPTILIVGAIIAAPFVGTSGGHRYDDGDAYEAYQEESPTFTGCTDDCSGHQAGYDWAQEKEISDPDECSGNSESFIEGCKMAAEEQAETIDTESGYEYEACGRFAC